MIGKNSSYYVSLKIPPTLYLEKTEYFRLYNTTKRNQWPLDE